MSTLIYPTLDVFLYDLREGFGQDRFNSEQKYQAFKRKLPQELVEQLDFSNKGSHEYVELLGQKRFERFEDSKYGSDQKQEMILYVLCLFSVNYKFNQHLHLITTQNMKVIIILLH